MIDSKYIKIFTGSFIVVTRILSELEAIGISPVVKDETESGRLAGFGAPIPGQQEVYVHEDELDKSVQIVEDIRSSMTT